MEVWKGLLIQDSAPMSMMLRFTPLLYVYRGREEHRQGGMQYNLLSSEPPFAIA